MAVGELQPPSTEDPLVGTVLSDRYRIHKKLGEGGMGAVYLAEHVFIEKKVALKVLAPELSRKADLTQRFLQEAKSASRIGHENVIDISDFGQSPEGLVYFAMEFLPGNDLGHALRAGAMPWSRAKPILVQICKALRAAHNKGIIHRDMKPENVFLITKGGSNDFVKLLDFGIAKVQGVGGEDAPKLTQTGMIFGTPEYMAPEQAEGKVCDLRADLYAVGCVMYHMIAGQAPFQADSFMAMLTKHLLEEPIKPSKKRPDLGIPPILDDIVMKALRKNRDERWKDMDDMLAQIEAVPVDAAGTVSTAAPEQPRPLARGAETRQFGGGDAMPIIATTPRVSNTAMVTVGPGKFSETDFGDADLAPRAKPKSNNGLLIVGGLLVGGAIAAGVLIFGGNKEQAAAPPAATTNVAPAPVAAPPPAPAPEPVKAVEPAPAPAPEEPVAATPTPVAVPSPAEAKGSRHRDKRSDKPASYRKIDLNEPEPEKPAKPKEVAPELKGFPGQ